MRESGGSSRVYEQGQTIDSYTVSLVSSPGSAVYVNVSAAASPSEAAAAGARTVLVSIDGGVTWQFAAVLTFAAGDSSAEDRPRPRRSTTRRPSSRSTRR